MNDDQLSQLFAAARQASTDTTRAELAFETRLLARLRAERRSARPWYIWTWRLAPVFAAIVLALGAWNCLTPATDLADLQDHWTGQPTETMLAAVLTGD